LTFAYQVRRVPIAPILGAFFTIETRVGLSKLHVLLKAMLRTPQPFSGVGAEADLCDGLYFMIRGHNHGAAL
jgi:hypothetical protein